MTQTHNILLIEHQKSTIELIRTELDKLDINIQLVTIHSKEELTDQLKNNLPDLIISAYLLPSVTGTEILKKVRKQHPQLPFILVSKYMGEAKAVDAMLEGASDFTTRKNIDRLGPAVLRELKNYTEYNKQRDKLTESRSRYQTLLQSVNGIVWECDAQSLTFQYVSPKSKELLGYSPEEWLNQPNFWQNHIHPDDCEEALSFCHHYTHQGQDHTFEYRMITANDEAIWLRDYVTVVMKNGKPDRLHGLMVDISQEKKAKEQRDKAYQIADIGHWEVDLIHERLYWSRAVKELHEVSPNFTPDFDNAFEFYKKANNQDLLTQVAQNTINKKEPFEGELKMITAKGNERWVKIVGEPVFLNDKCVRIYGSTQDITSSKKAERKLQQSIKRYEVITKATSDTIFEWDRLSEEITYNENLSKTFGYPPDQIGSHYRWWADQVHPSDLPALERKIDQALSTNKNRIQFEYRFQCADESYKHVFSRTFIIRNKEGKPIRLIGTMQDISTFKKREQRNRKFQQVISSLATNRSLLRMNILEALSEVLKASAQALKIQRVNIWLLKEDSMRCICSYEGGETNIMSGQRLTQEKYPKYFHYIRKERTIASTNPYDHEAHTELIDSYLKPNNIKSLLDTSVHSYGSTHVIVCHETVRESREWLSDEISFAGAITDQIAHLLAYQEKKEKEKKIRESLQEKETLLTEVHHRVKNNLAVISGMMQLQAYEQVNQEVKDKLLDSIARIQTMAGIHELLYSSNSFSKLRLDENIQKLVSEIAKTFQMDDQLKLDFNLEPLTINVNQAIPCSLIINEVVTNALKHAFHEGEEGAIYITLSEKNNTIFLVIKDNGKGLPDEYKNLVQQESLGFRLIDTLATQLEAESQFISQNNGTQFSLQFKRSELKGTGSSWSEQD